MAKTAEKKKAKDGVYEVILREEIEVDGETVKCPVTSVSIPCVTGMDPRLGKERRFMIQATAGCLVFQLECPKCKHRWEPEQPLRPGAALKLDGEAKYRERYQKSFMCPKCDTKGAQLRTPKGQTPPHRRVHKKWFLKADELLEMKRLLDPEIDRVPAYDTVKGMHGQEIKMFTGYEQQPLTHRFRDKDGVFREVPLGQFVQVRPASSDDSLSVDALELNAETHRNLVEVMKLLGEIKTERDNLDSGSPDYLEKVEIIELQREDVEKTLAGLEKKLDGRK